MGDFIHPDIENLDREQIENLQKDKLAKLGERLSKSPEWVSHFAETGMDPTDLAAKDGLSNAPFLGKSDLHSRYPFPFLTEPIENVRRFIATSGTTGLPVMFGMTGYDLGELLPYQMKRILNAAGVEPGQRVYQGYGYGLWVGGLALDVGLEAMGCVNFPIGPGRSDLVVRWLCDHEYDIATMSPLWLMTLISKAREMGIDPKSDWKLKAGILGGQSVSVAFRNQLEFEMPDGFIAHNVYGTTEAGGPILAVSTEFTHDEDELQLVNEDTILTEILDPQSMKPVAPGEVGEIVITTLNKQASPVVRWRTRDLVQLSKRPFDCPSGRRGMARIGRIVGRSDDMLKVNGVIIFPSQVEDIIANTKGTVKEAWQIYIDKEATTISEITIACEAQKSVDRAHDVITEEVGREIHSRLGIRAKIDCFEEGSLPRYEAKATRVLHRPRGADHA